MITYEEAARMVEAEGRLGTDTLINSLTKLRCVVSVVRNFTGNLDVLSPYEPVLVGAMGANDEFVGTPEERATYMAAWFRSRLVDVSRC